MISADDLGWVTADYDDFTSEYGDPTFEFLLEQYSLDISTVSDPTKGTVGLEYTVDADLCGDVIIRVFHGTNQIKVGTLANEDAGNQSWAEATLAATNLDEDVPPSLGVNGNTCRIFWYNGTQIRYFESTDKPLQISGLELILACDDADDLLIAYIFNLLIKADLLQVKYYFCKILDDASNGGKLVLYPVDLNASDGIPFK